MEAHDCLDTANCKLANRRWAMEQLSIIKRLKSGYTEDHKYSLSLLNSMVPAGGIGIRSPIDPP